MLGFDPALPPGLTAGRGDPQAERREPHASEEAHWTTATRYVAWRWPRCSRSARSRPRSALAAAPGGRADRRRSSRTAPRPRPRRRHLAPRRADRRRRHAVLAGDARRSRRCAVSSRTNRRLQRLAYKELGLARATLAARAVAMYKHDDVTPHGRRVRRRRPRRPRHAADHGAHHRPRATGTSCAPSRRTKRELTRPGGHAGRRRAHGREARRHLQDASSPPSARSLDERRAALAGVRSDIRRLAAADRSRRRPRPRRPSSRPPAGRRRRRRLRARGGRSSRARPRATASARAACTAS